MSVDKIKRQHILDAVEKIEREGIELKPSTKFDVIINDKAYPPKEIMRYANLLANGEKKWPQPGGNPTNKYLRAFDFKIVSKVEEPEPPATNEEIVELLRKIGREAATTFFDSASHLMNLLKVKQSDARVTYGTRANNRFSITIGQRYCFAYIPKDDNPWQFIHEKKIKSTDAIEVGEFDNEPLAYFYHCVNSNDMLSRMDGIVLASQKELNRTEVSGYRKYNNSLFEKALFDNIYKNELFEAAFSGVASLSGNVWKLGCQWGSKKPSFYELIKKRSIVIGVEDKLYSPGDLIVVTEGYTVRALAKVLEVPKSVTDASELEEDFATKEIEYEPWVKFANAEWYELEPDEIFTYQLQQGICRVNVPYVRNKAITIWNDRFINYWVFQCNPADFDFETAVRSNLLHDWTVAAHKEKIKKGDKVILWVTGKKAGCYALARVTSDPAEKSNSPDSHLWKTENKNPLKAGIELTHNLLAKPLMWQTIKETEGLQELKVGNQGTNFAATKQQYNTIIKVIEKSTQNMSTKIDVFINTILYGPPGTGKTFKLNEYKEEYFTDRGITKTSEEVLKEKVSAYPFWKIFAAILSVKNKYCSVAEIMEHPLVKAKVNDTAKTPQNTIWRILQSYADYDSSQMNEKYRGPLQIFNKNQNSEWAIIDSKKAEIVNIVEEELLAIAAHPEQQPVQSAISKARFNFITFHQKYSYEDFIEGIKPLLQEAEVDEAVGQLQFELKKGIFYNSCLEALKLVGYSSFEECQQDKVENRIAKFAEAKGNTSKQFALFIDEINRANISAVFGELITLLEDDKRIGADNEMWVELPYSNEKFSVPSNLYVIGTMNTADRSIALLDIALRRRFEFKALYPEYKETEWWASLLESINQAIYNWKKNPDFFIGHAFFINKPESDKVKILNTKIIPLLYEYCQNNSDTVKRILTEAKISIKQSGIKENFQIIAE
jgi:hypothetical protein